MPTSTEIISYNLPDSLNMESIFLQIYNVINGIFGGGGNISFLDITQSAWFYFQIISYGVSFLLFIGVVYSIMGIRQVRMEEAEIYNAPKEESSSVEEHKNEKWQHIVELTSSENPSDWRLAILEADILLDEVVSRIGYKGDTLGEKLKNIEQSDFTTLDHAWEAHKVRNIIAHTGSDFILTQRESRRVIDLYRQVFEEFQLL